MIRRLLPPRLSAADVDSLLDRLSRPKPTPLRIDRFAPGIDGAHIDVALGPAMEKSARLFVSALVQEEVAGLLGQSSTSTSDTVLPLFREQLREHHAVAVTESRDGKALERMQLFQLAMLKLLLREVDAELARVREKNDVAMNNPVGTGSRGLALHREAALLSRSSSRIRFRSARRAIVAFRKLENSLLRNFRQSVLGNAWPVSETLLFNPLLQLDGVGALPDFKASYPVLLHDLSVARRVGKCLMTTLSDWLPEGIGSVSQDESGRSNNAIRKPSADQVGRGQLALQPWVNALIGGDELGNGLATWMDEPANLSVLLGTIADRGPDAMLERGDNTARLQRDLVARFAGLLRRDNLHRKAMAAYVLADIYPTLGLIDAEAPVFDYLAGEGNRKQLQRRLDALNQDLDVVQVTRRIDESANTYRRSPQGNKHAVAIRLAGDFCTLRRDIKLAHQAYDALARIRLLNDPDSLELARSNHTLQLFCPKPQPSTSRGSLIGHTIVRVDVRGANDLVAALLRRGMKPAEFFSRHWFDPVSQATSDFGAQKVSVEVDALVLVTVEYADASAEQLPVARACALAMRLLANGEALNAETERLGLEQLEFSLGIVFSDTAPTYLYDQSRRVLVSAANTRARKMAACHPILRQRCSLPDGRGLCVASPVPGADEPVEPQALVRYNLNGIEMDAAAFARLTAELSLRKVKIGDPRIRGMSKLYVGRSLDVAGTADWIVVREQPVKLWMGRQLLESASESRTFFEVVVDPALVDQVLERLGEKPMEGRATVQASRL